MRLVAVKINPISIRINPLQSSSNSYVKVVNSAILDTQLEKPRDKRTTRTLYHFAMAIRYTHVHIDTSIVWSDEKLRQIYAKALAASA